MQNEFEQGITVLITPARECFLTSEILIPPRGESESVCDRTLNAIMCTYYLMYSILRGYSILRNAKQVFNEYGDSA